MNNFVLEKWDDEAGKCVFYSVRKEGATQNETDKFFSKYREIPAFTFSAQLLWNFVVDCVGQLHGAIDQLFNRYENEVVGLPNKGKAVVGELVFLFPDFPLRLYALRVNNREDLVVLFNGGVKSARTNQASRELSLKWREACQFAARIEEALRNKEIFIDEKTGNIIAADNNNEIIL